MFINGSDIYLSEEDRNILKRFFAENLEWLENNSLLYYENVKTFGDMYEKFLDENVLRGNNILTLFWRK